MATAEHETFKNKLARHLLPWSPINRRTFDILRYEVNAVLLQVKNLVNPAFHFRKNAVRKKTGLLVNIGSGGKGLDGWINTDIRRHSDTYFQLDIRRRLPFAPGSVSGVLAEHVLEHIEFREDLPNFLHETHRILEAGGVLRIVVPDGQRFLEAYAGKNPANWKALGWDLEHMPDDIFTPMHIVNHIFHQSGEHLFAYDFDTLKLLLERSGFRKVVKQQFHVSIDARLAIDQENHHLYSLYLDAVK